MDALLDGRRANAGKPSARRHAAIACRSCGARSTPSPACNVCLALASARFLASLVRPDGRFLYRYRYRGSASEPIPGYNNVRHAGCVWALNLALRERADPAIEDAAERATGWLAAHALVPSGQVGIAIQDAGKLKLGGSALAVVALLSSPHPSMRDRRRAAALCEHIWAQRRDDGDFHHVRLMDGDRVTDFRSDYYTGEALFALLLAGERLDDARWSARGRTALDMVVSTGYGIAQQSHWMMYAAETAYRTHPDPALLRYAALLADDIVRRPLYRDCGACTPIACRTEALLAFLRMAPARSGAPAAGAVRQAVADNLALQLADRLPDGSFRCARHNQQVRIDYIQHNLVSLLLSPVASRPASSGLPSRA